MSAAIHHHAISGFTKNLRRKRNIFAPVSLSTEEKLKMDDESLTFREKYEKVFISFGNEKNFYVLHMQTKCVFVSA